MDERFDAGRLLEETGGGSTFSKPSPMTPEYAAFVEHKLRVYKPPGKRAGREEGPGLRLAAGEKRLLLVFISVSSSGSSHASPAQRPESLSIDS